MAHNLQCNGTKVPDWVKESCCGVSDYHLLNYDQIRDAGDYYEVTVHDAALDKDRVLKVAHDKALPSPDGCAAIFFPNGVADPAIYCFFFNPGI